MKKKNRGFCKILRTGILALTMTMLLALSFRGMSVYAYENTWGVVKDGDARIRSSASTDSSVLASVISGDRVEICGTETGADGYTWYRVYVNGSTIGYIRSDRLTDTGEKTGSISDNQTGGGQNGGQTEPLPEESEQSGNGEEGTNTEPSDEPADPGDGTGENTSGEGSGISGVSGTSSSDASLYALNISNGTLTPAFSPAITEYTITVDEDTTSVSAFGVPNGEGASVVENYGFSDLVKGSNMAVITVQAQDGTRQSYYFTVNRGAPSEEIHYSQPTGVGGQADSEADPAAEKAGGSSHTGLIVFLVIVLLAMAAVMVLMGLRIRDYRRDLYGEAPEEFHLRDAIPESSVFHKKNNVAKRSVSAEAGRKASGKASRAETGGTPANDEGGEDDGGYSGGAFSDLSREASEAMEHDTPVYEESYSAAFAADSREEEILRESRENSFMMEDGFLYNIKEAGASSDTSMGQDLQYNGQQKDSGLEPDEDELEDIMERNATITDNQSGKEVWKSVNFMTPAEDLEFEFLDLEDENE